MIPCKCGCGELILGRAKDSHINRKIYYKTGHNRRGQKMPEEARTQISLSLKGKYTNEKHSQWKGDEAGYGAIHLWVRKNKSKPDFCEICNKRAPDDVASITGVHKRDVNYYEWLCTPCHMLKDAQRRRRKQ